MAVTGERRLLVGIEGADETGAGDIGVFGDEADERQRGNGRGHHEVLPLLELEADAHGDFGKFFELLRIDGGIGHNSLLSEIDDGNLVRRAANEKVRR